MDEQGNGTMQVEVPARVPQARDGLAAWVRDLAVSLAVVVIAVMLVILFLYQPVRVEGTSMLPMLKDQDRLFINKFAYSPMGSMVGETIHRGDVVVFYYPYDTTKSYIKRVIAEPGDTLRIDHGRVFVNGEQIAEPYVPAKFADERSQSTETIPVGKYFVMGDHRSISSDSRDFGPVPRNLIYGRASFVYWPVDQAGAVK